MGVITFDGRCSKDYGIVIEHFPDHEYPEKDYEVVHVPGRNGDLLFDLGSYKNIQRTYEIAAGSRVNRFSDLAESIVSWLLPTSGYARLEDSYEPEVFRLAAYREANTLTNILGHAARASVVFDCKPQVFLKSGEISLTYTTNGIICNPTRFASSPLLQVAVSANTEATLQIGEYELTLASASSAYTIVIDCDLQDAYIGTENANSRVTMDNGEYPKIVPDFNEISFTGITSVIITPRWWTL